MTKVILENDGDADYCADMGCINLYRDQCPGPGHCARLIKMTSGVQIYAGLDGAQARYVTSIAKKH